MSMEKSKQNVLLLRAAQDGNVDTYEKSRGIYNEICGQVIPGYCEIIKKAFNHVTNVCCNHLLKQTLQDVGYNAHSVPVLSFNFINLDILSSRLSTVDQFAGCVFTSQRAIEATNSASLLINEWETIIKQWHKLPAFVVGAGTSKMASECGFKTVGAASGSADALLPVIIQEIKPGGKPLLYPCGNLKRDTLPKRLQNSGLALTELTVYETNRHPQLDDTLHEYLQSEGLPDYVVFFSPSGVRVTHEVFHKYGVSFQSVKIAL